MICLLSKIVQCPELGSKLVPSVPKATTLLSEGVRVMMFNTTFNNNSVISWWSVLLVEETGEPEKTTDLSQVTDKLYHIMLY